MKTEKQIEALATECDALREKAFDLAIKRGADLWDATNQLTLFGNLLDFILDEEDNRGFNEWLSSPRAKWEG